MSQDRYIIRYKGPFGEEGSSGRTFTKQDARDTCNRLLDRQGMSGYVTYYWVEELGPVNQNGLAKPQPIDIESR